MSLEGVKKLCCENKRIVFFRRREENIKGYHENKIQVIGSSKIKDQKLQPSWQRSFLKEEPFEGCQNDGQRCYLVESKDNQETRKVITQSVKKVNEQLVESNSFFNWNGNVFMCNNKNIGKNERSTMAENTTNIYFIKQNNSFLLSEEQTIEMAKYDDLKRSNSAIIMNSKLLKNELKGKSDCAVNCEKEGYLKSHPISDQKEVLALMPCSIQSDSHSSLPLQRIEFAKQVSVKLAEQGVKDCHLKFAQITVRNCRNNKTKKLSKSTNFLPEPNCQSNSTNFPPAHNRQSNIANFPPAQNYQSNNANFSPKRNCRSHGVNISPAPTCHNNCTNMSPARNCENNHANMSPIRNCQSPISNFSPVQNGLSNNVNISPVHNHRSLNFQPMHNDQSNGMYILKPNTLGPRSVQYTVAIDKGIEEDNSPIKIRLENHNSLLSKYPGCEMTLEYLELRSMHDRLKNRQLHWYCDCPLKLQRSQALFH